MTPSDIVERLRGISDEPWATFGKFLAGEAADEIERLRAENGKLYKQRQASDDAFDGILVENERLRTALLEITTLGDVRADEASMIAKRALTDEM
jgi:hypothetical protein